MKEIDYDENKNEIIALYSDESDTESFAAAKIVGINNDFICFHSIAPNGKYDGMQIMMVEDIFQTEKETKYLVNLKKLMEFNYDASQEVNYSKEISIFGMCEFAFENKEIICLLLEIDETVTGYIESFDENKIILRQFGFYAEFDGVTQIDLDTVTRAMILSEGERKIKTLVEGKNYIL